ncbi:hypothetical protein DL765_003203 [Monosporascus sp. GIB2]|nr:hypothetical protein DL765_003203 [Monosporascus sp. GIB2]
MVAYPNIHLQQTPPNTPQTVQSTIHFACDQEYRHEDRRSLAPFYLPIVTEAELNEIPFEGVTTLSRLTCPVCTRLRPANREKGFHNGLHAPHGMGTPLLDVRLGMLEKFWVVLRTRPGRPYFWTHKRYMHPMHEKRRSLSIGQPRRPTRCSLLDNLVLLIYFTTSFGGAGDELDAIADAHLPEFVLAVLETIFVPPPSARITSMLVQVQFQFGVLGYLTAGLVSSLALYRLIWHPLRGFPGPLFARVSSIWFSAHVAKNKDAHKKALELYNQYGPFVRVGSSDLMVAHPMAVPVIHGPQSACQKGTWYDEDWPRRSIHTCRDPQFHRQRRRAWSKVFSDRALRGYESRIAIYNAALLQRLSESEGEPLNASRWFEYHTFDVMGDLAFDQDFGMLKSGQQHWAVGLLDEAMNIQGLKLPTWFFRMLIAIPGITKTYWKFINYCDEQLAVKMQREKCGKSSTTNLMSELIAQVGPHPSHQDILNLQADSRTIIVAGSDTTAASLSHILFLLARHPEHVDRLRQELLPHREVDGKSFEHRKIQHLDHLNAVINEALRLYPVTPTTLVRKTPPEGIVVDGTFIPGDMSVWTPSYVIGRSELAYEKPYEFIPERWYSEPAMIKEMAGYAPFSTGPYGCIGKPLALLQLRTLVAEIVVRFNISFAPGRDGSEFIEHVRDRFTWGLAGLELCFKPYV